jgi:transglutaminase-like putative cysteine protease
MLFSVKHVTWYSYTEAVPFCHNLVHLAPRDTVSQTCGEHRLTVSPAPASVERTTDYFGNAVDFFTVRGSHLSLKVTSESKVDVEPAPLRDAAGSPAWEDVVKSHRENLTSEGLAVLQFTFPSPRVPRLDALRDYAARSFGPQRPILEAVLDLNARIHADFVFDTRSTTIDTTLEEVLRMRRGVCQDFAHLAIGCLRSVGLAARYVSGYISTIAPPGRPRLVGADVSHAWASVHCGPWGWVDLDPTNNVLVSDSHVSVGWGRDYGDVCPIQGVFVGGGEHKMSVAVDVVPQPA